MSITITAKQSTRKKQRNRRGDPSAQSRKLPSCPGLELKAYLNLQGPRILVTGRDAEAGAARQGQRWNQIAVGVEGQVARRLIRRAVQLHLGVAVGDARLVERIEHVNAQLETAGAAEFQGAGDGKIHLADEAALQ